MLLPRPVAAAIAPARPLLARFGSDAGLALLARILQNANGFLLSVIIVRRFGMAAAGTMAIATVSSALVGLLGALGLPYVFARSKEPVPVLNGIGLAAAIVVVPLSLPFIGFLGSVWGRTWSECLVIVFLAMGGPFFAQVNILTSLQVLQGRTAHAIIPGAANLLGLVIGAWLGSTYLWFAILLTLFRFAGIAGAFLLLPKALSSVRTVLDHFREGAHFLTADALNLGADQAIVLATSWLMSRADLGLFGLCRQMLTVSDTPGWSKMQAEYPNVVRDPARNMPAVRRVMVLTGVACGAVMAALIVPMSLWMFRQPRLIPLVWLLMVSVPLRYLLSGYDMQLRAARCIRRSNLVSLARSVLGIVIVPPGAWAEGVLGAVLATIVQTTLGVLINRYAVVTADYKAITDPVGLGEVAD